MQSPPDEVKLSREESEALIERIQASSLAGDDQRVLVKLIQLYFWFTVALRETKISLKRLKRALFGEDQRRPPPPAAPPAAGGGGRRCRDHGGGCYPGGGERGHRQGPG